MKSLAKINKSTLLNLFVGLVLLFVLVLAVRSIVTAFATANKVQEVDESAVIKLEVEAVDKAYNQLNSRTFSPLDLGN